MAERPNPTQTPRLDELTVRRDMKHLVPGNMILDHAEEKEILDLSNSSGRVTHLRILLLRAALFGNPRPSTLGDSDRTELLRYMTSGGPRPVWAKLASPDGHYGIGYLDGRDPAAHAEPTYGPPEDPREPRRYVEPTGRFALPGSPSWAPDTR
jgi:hypothetical protein